ncbi:TolB family protein [Streptomyces sviceus]|uniref:TolB family protein n=1 Tax=Streptomyces sviceus TaxID=285530 RepID=UPI003825CA92
MQRRKHWAAGFLAALATAALTGPAAGAAPGAPHTKAPYTEKATVAPDGTEGNAGSGGQSISADGRRVAFVSGADNLVAGDTNGLEDAFVRDLKTGITRLASAGEDGNPWHGHVLDLSLSANGRYLAFTSNATYDTADNHIWIKDLRTGTLQRVDDAVDPDAGYVSAGAPALSADGRYVAFVALHSGSEGPAGDRSSPGLPPRPRHRRAGPHQPGARRDRPEVRRHQPVHQRGRQPRRLPVLRAVPHFGGLERRLRP